MRDFAFLARIGRRPCGDDVAVGVASVEQSSVSGFLAFGLAAAARMAAFSSWRAPGAPKRKAKKVKRGTRVQRTGVVERTSIACLFGLTSH